MSKIVLPPVAILAGGLATRLRSLTQTIPKSMIEVRGEPFVAHQLRLLAIQGFERVVMCVGHLAHQIEAFVGDGSRFGIHVDFSREAPDRLLGTGGALKLALPLLGETFTIIYGDSFLTAPLRPSAEAFVNSGKHGLMTVFRNDDQWDKSNVIFDGRCLIAYSKVDKLPDMKYIDYGFGGLRSSVFAGYPDGHAFDLADVYRSLLDSGDLLGYEVFDRFYEIGTPDGINETEQYLIKQAK